VISVPFRLFAIFLLVTVVRTFPSAIALIDQAEPKPSLALVALVSVLGLALCASHNAIRHDSNRPHGGPRGVERV